MHHFDYRNGALFAEDVDLTALAEGIRGSTSGPDAERMVWAFEHALRAARIDPELRGHLLSAVVCLLARAEGASPRSVLDLFFRRAVSDQVWRERYLPLFG